MVYVPETLQERFDRVSKEQKATLVVCPDDFRRDASGLYSHEGDMGFIAWKMALRVLDDLLPGAGKAVALCGAPGAGKSTWIAANREDGVLYLDSMLARRLSRRLVCLSARSAGTPIDCVFLDVELDVCEARNALRAPDRVVPLPYLLGAHHRLSVCPPEVSEGWRTVQRFGSDGALLGAAQDAVLDSRGSRP